MEGLLSLILHFYADTFNDLAETLGSCGAANSVAQGQRVVGLDLNAKHIKGTTSGRVIGVARPTHIGCSTQIWQVELTCVARITMAVLTPKPALFRTHPSRTIICKFVASY